MGSLRRRQQAGLLAGNRGACARTGGPGAALPAIPCRTGQAREARVIPLSDARERVLSGCPAPSGSAVVAAPLDEALGCVLAEAIVSKEAVPPFANTAMD